MAHYTGIYPKKSLGQNFLKIVPDSLLPPDEVLNPKDRAVNLVVEIGPGLGDVTKRVVQQLNSVPAKTYLFLIEKDSRFISHLEEMLDKMSVSNIGWEVINQDVLTVELQQLLDKNAVLDNGKKLQVYMYGSLPYNVSKKIITWSIQQSSFLLGRLDKTVVRLAPFRFLIQKEVAEHYVSEVPNKDFLSVFLDMFTESKRVLETVPAALFIPKPKVDGAVLEFVLNKDRLLQYQKLISMSKFVKQFYNYRRKTLGKISRKILKTGLEVPTELITKRPEELTLQEWELIYQTYQQP